MFQLEKACCFRLWRTAVSCMGLCSALQLGGCAVSGSSALTHKELAGLLPQGWQVSTHDFDAIAVMAAIPPAQHAKSTASDTGDVLTVFVEGDGRSWRTRSMPSNDPTPARPVALQLALAGLGKGRVAYLARPCQFDARERSGCEETLWTHRRYSQYNLDALTRALDELKRDEEQLMLIGYSGGGVMAALLGATRDDVLGFVTIAANLDTSAWTRLHKVTALAGSLEPLDYADRLAALPQVHLVGGRDEIVPAHLMSAYLNRAGVEESGRVIVEPGFDHHCCWVDDWQQLYGKTMNLLDQQIMIVNETLK